MGKRKNRAVAVLGIGAALVFGVLYLTMTATAGKTKAAGMQPECYSSISESGGDTSADVANGYVQTAAFEIQTKSGEIKTKGWIKAKMHFDVFGGSSMRGFLVVDFYVNGYGPGHFESKCIVEGETALDGDDDECDSPEECVPVDSDNFSGEFEGTLTGGKLAASPVVAQLAGGHTAGGNVLLKLEIEKGTQCNGSDDWIDGGNTASKAGKSSGSVNADDVDEFRRPDC